MTDRRLDNLLRGLKRLVDEFEPDYHTHGPMRVRFGGPPSGKDAPWRVTVDAGWDHNASGPLVIEASRTGKSLRVFSGDKELHAPVS